MGVIGRTPGGKDIAAWILKGDPKVYDLDRALSLHGKVESWSVHESYRTQLMASGQRCFLWRSGQHGALVAAGCVTGPVERRSADPQKWEDRARAHRANLFVAVDLYPLDEEIERFELKTHPMLSTMELFRSPRMSNPSIVTPEELGALELLLT